MVDTGTGNLYIVGSFKRMSPDPDFKVKVRDMHVRGYWCLKLSFDVCISARVVACLLALDQLIWELFCSSYGGLESKVMRFVLVTEYVWLSDPFFGLAKLFSGFRKCAKSGYIFVVSGRPSAWNNSVPAKIIFLKFCIG